METKKELPESSVKEGSSEEVEKESAVQTDAAAEQTPQADAVAEQGSAPEENHATDQAPKADPVNKKSFFRASGGWTDIFIIAAILSVLLLFFGEFLTLLFTVQLFPLEKWALSIIPDADAVSFLYMYFSTVGGWIAFLLVAVIFKNNRPMLKSFFYNDTGNRVPAIFIGILLGGGMNAFCVLMSCLQGDIKLSFNEFNPLLFFAFLFCVWVQSGSEEIIDRCYLYQKLRRRYRWPAIAILGNALIFCLLHALNPGVTVMGLLQVFLIGLLFSLIVYFYDSLWTVIWAHTAWNFSQSIVFGLPNSGIVSKYSVFKLDAASARDGFFYNTGFGVEGSVGSSIIITSVIVIVLILAYVQKRGEKVDRWEELEQEIAVNGHTVRAYEGIIWTVVIAAALVGMALPYIL